MENRDIADEVRQLQAKLERTERARDQALGGDSGDLECGCHIVPENLMIFHGGRSGLFTERIGGELPF